MSKKIRIKSAPGTNPPNNTEGTVDLVNPGLYFEETGTPGSGNYLFYAPSQAQPPGPATVIVTTPTPLTSTTTSFSFYWMGLSWTITQFVITASTASGSWAAESGAASDEMPTEGDVETGTFQANDTVDDVAADSASASA